MEYILSDIIELIGGGTPKTSIPEYWDGDIPWLSVKDFSGEKRYVYETEKSITEEGLNNSSTKYLNQDDIIVSARGTVGEMAMIPFPMTFNQSCYGIRAKRHLVDPFYLYSLMKYNLGVLKSKVHGSVFDTITKDTFKQITVDLPCLEVQKKVAAILGNLDDKIEINEKINRNLEDQLKAIFIELFGAEIDAVKTGTGTPLGELIDVIDNRGKTPPLTTETFDFPIIDVGALRGNVRVIDFNNCTKFVDEDTYNNWFRSGHPKPWDILLSTVGSLAEMKIFLGEKGCIAQNVVALRSKVIAPLFLYQYLNYIRNDLVAYNIGSVQPSIKVTHIIKHPIFVPDEVRLAAFEDIAKVISDQIYMLYSESEVLKGIRDSLLPKLMSGELDVCDCEI